MTLPPAVLACAALLGPAAAAWGLPPRFEVTDRGVTVAGVSADSPVIYDNDWWTDVPDAAYLWARASAGRADLRGNVVTRDMWEWRSGYKFSMDDCEKEARELFAAAKASGLRDVPAPVQGAAAALERPAGGAVADTKFARTPGSDLIVAEARRATPDRPLVIFCGGPCTTVATAYLTDPAIADRVVLFQVDGGVYNGKDDWAWEICERTLPFANWARGYFWGEWSGWEAAPFDALPENPLCDRLRRYARDGLGPANQWGDGAWPYHLYAGGCLTDAAPYGDGAGITVPREAVDVGRMKAELFAALADPVAYRPAAPPAD